MDAAAFPPGQLDVFFPEDVKDIYAYIQDLIWFDWGLTTVKLLRVITVITFGLLTGSEWFSRICDPLGFLMS